LKARSKKQTAARFIELGLDLKIPKAKYSLVEEALSAVLGLAGLKVSTSAADKPKASEAAPAPRAGRKTKQAKAAAKPAKAAAPGRRTKTSARAKLSAAAALIRDLRSGAGLSQQALADKTGVRQNLISLLETGRQKPNLDLAIKLGQILKAPFKNFME